MNTVERLETIERWIVEEDHYDDIWTPWYHRGTLQEYRFKSLESAEEQYEEYRRTFHYSVPREYRFVKVEIQPEYIVDRTVIKTEIPEENK